MIEYYLGLIANISGTGVFVMFCACMIRYLPLFMKEWYLELVDRHNHYRLRRKHIRKLENIGED